MPITLLKTSPERTGACWDRVGETTGCPSWGAKSLVPHRDSLNYYPIAFDHFIKEHRNKTRYIDIPIIHTKPGFIIKFNTLSDYNLFSERIRIDLVIDPQ